MHRINEPPRPLVTCRGDVYLVTESAPSVLQHSGDVSCLAATPRSQLSQTTLSGCPRLAWVGGMWAFVAPDETPVLTNSILLGTGPSAGQSAGSTDVWVAAVSTSAATTNSHSRARPPGRFARRIRS